MSREQSWSACSSVNPVDSFARDSKVLRCLTAGSSSMINQCLPVFGYCEWIDYLMNDLGSHLPVLSLYRQVLICAHALVSPTP